VCRSKHVEPSINGGIINSIAKVASCWLFLLSSIVMYIEDKIRFLSIMVMFVIDYRDYVSNIKTKTERGIGHSD